MNEVNEMDLTPEYVDGLVQRHRWAATGVSDYPPRDPLVGQSRFFRRYKTFIKTVDQDQDNFAHVFAVEGEWGRGKSRLGHELIAQINDCSRGWHVRGETGALEQAVLFEDAQRRDAYLGLYIRYSQLASDYQNSDNWFAYGLYKALLPLATKAFDGSIQSEIARQALRRLEPEGFAPSHLRELLQLDSAHTEEQLYFEPHLVTDLVKAAYAYLQTFGIAYVLVVLDKLETVAEAATFGIEQDQAKRLDGPAIRLIGKAIKEEDPRRALPWLRYVALCSPLLGQQLREIQSVARRFELVELEHNAFADVSDYVSQLRGPQAGLRLSDRSGGGGLRHERGQLRLVQRDHGECRRGTGTVRCGRQADPVPARCSRRCWAVPAGSPPMSWTTTPSRGSIPATNPCSPSQGSCCSASCPWPWPSAAADG